MDDSKIIDLYFERDDRAIQETDEKYGKLCRRIAVNVLNDVHDAEECVNDTYFGVWGAIPPQRPKSLSAFVAKIARNLALKRLEYKSASKRASGVLVSISELESVLPDSLVHSGVEDAELGEWISEFLRTETPQARGVFIRKYWFFDSVSEIAELYSFTEAKVKSMLFHSRNRLKKYLETKGVYV